METSRLTQGPWFDHGKSAFVSVTYPQSGPLLRDILRVLSLVGALHEAGYQRIRVFTCLSPSGTYWRCLITSADNVQENGWDIEDIFSNVVRYSSGEEAAPFGWEDAGNKSACELARRFVERFPRVAALGAGSDQDYADWFAGMMVTARTGRVPVFAADYEIDLSAVSVPPPPGDLRQPGVAADSGIRH